MEKELTFRIPTDIERFDLYWQSEQGWAAFWDLLNSKELKAADWKRAVENAFCAGFAAGFSTTGKMD